jgi:hypothetical protein
MVAGQNKGSRNRRLFLRTVLLACGLTIAGLWVASGWYWFWLEWGPWNFTLGRGSIEVTRYHQILENRAPACRVQRIAGARGAFAWWPLYEKIPLLRSRFSEGWRVTALALPGALLIFPLGPFAFLSVRARYRSRAGHCPDCGYDLRGISRGAACPECGVSSTRI